MNPPLGLALVGLLLVLGAAIQWFRLISAVRIPANRWPFVTCWMIGALLGAAAIATGNGGWVSVAATLALAGGVFFLLTIAISRQRVASDSIALGATLPTFTALDENGTSFSSASLAGRPALIKFFRGHW